MCCLRDIVVYVVVAGVVVVVINLLVGQCVDCTARPILVCGPFFIM